MADRYELLDVIGSGGMATVWRATDTHLGRTVALKRPHPAPDDSDVHERFRREARAAATVTHPNLVTVFDAGADEQGPFIVMELVEAPSLAATSFDDVDAATLGREIASALAVLHERGIVHRDVKPANILVAPAGAQLTDFGIARSNDDTAALTQAGVTFATPAYAPPEVLAHGVYSEASDVYSLAAVLHEIVTGRRVVPDSDTQVLVTDPIWNPLLDAALSPDPARRPSAAEFAARLANATVASATGTTTTAMPTEAAASPGASRILDSVEPVTVAQPRSPEEQNRRRLVGFLGALSILAVGLVAAAVVGGDDNGGDGSTATPSATAVAVDADPGVDPAVGVAEATGDEAGDTPAPPSVVEPIPDEVVAALGEIDAARNDFVAFVSGLPEDEISPKELEKLVEEVGAAIDAMAGGDADTAMNELGDAFDRIDKKIESDETRQATIDRLSRVARSLGLNPAQIVIDR